MVGGPKRSILKIERPGGVDHAPATDHPGPGTADGDLAFGVEDGTGLAGVVALGTDGTLHLPQQVVAGVQAKDAVGTHLEEGGVAAGDGFGQDGQDAALGPEEAGGQNVAGGEDAKDAGLLLGGALGRLGGGSGGVELGGKQKRREMVRD